MLERFRGALSSALTIVAQRLTGDPRYPNAHRIPHSSRTLAGVAITADTAITVPAVWACLRYLSQTVAVLPWHVKRDGKLGAEIQSSHPVDWLLWKRPSREWSSFQFRETLLHWALRYGNGYAEIERDQLGRPLALWPIHPERVWVCRATEDIGDEIRAGDLYYDVTNYTTSDASAARIPVPAADMFHVRGFGEGPVGVNVMDYAAQTIGWARAASLFGASFFGNGMNIAGVVTNKKPLRAENLARQKAEFDQLYKGPRNANKTAFLDNDADWKPIGVDPQKAQLIDAGNFLVEEICRFFGVPPHKVQQLLRATFTNIESQGIEVVVDSISPWVKRFEDEADFKLFGQNRSGLYTKIDMRALMRGDAAARIAYYRGMREIGAYSVNRILELEDENEIGPDGDLHMINSTYRTLEWVADQPTTTATASTTTDPAADPAAPAADPANPQKDPVAPAPPGEDDTPAAEAHHLIAMDAVEAIFA